MDDCNSCRWQCFVSEKWKNLLVKNLPLWVHKVKIVSVQAVGYDSSNGNEHFSGNSFVVSYFCKLQCQVVDRNTCLLSFFFCVLYTRFHIRHTCCRSPFMSRTIISVTIMKLWIMLGSSTCAEDVVQIQNSTVLLNTE